MINNEILKAVQMIVDKSNKDKYGDIIAPITEVNGDKCTVLIMNKPYKVKNGIGIEFRAGDMCLIHCIYGEFQHKVIIAKL